jgi:hypothetical protein
VLCGTGFVVVAVAAVVVEVAVVAEDDVAAVAGVAAGGGWLWTAVRTAPGVAAEPGSTVAAASPGGWCSAESASLGGVVSFRGSVSSLITTWPKYILIKLQKI